MTFFTFFRETLPGILFVSALSAAAYLLGASAPLVGGPVFGIVLGISIAPWQKSALMENGIHFVSRKILSVSIILLGFEMNLYNVFDVGSKSLYIIICTLSAAFFTAWFFGRYLNQTGKTSILIGVGTAICGGSAIAATAPVISATDKDVAYSISTIFLFNIAAVFIFPFAGHLMGMSDLGFGLWAGTAINDTSSVVAAGYSYSSMAGDYATIVKLTRALMIVPVTLILAFAATRNNNAANYSFLETFPWFILGFLLASILTTVHWISPSAASFFGHLGKFSIIMAMTAIGLNTQVKQLARNGVKPILLGLACWISVALASIIAQHFLALW